MTIKEKVNPEVEQTQEPELYTNYNSAPPEQQEESNPPAQEQIEPPTTEPETKVATPRQSNWSERVYFIRSTDDDFFGLKFKTEKEALQYIIDCGKVDVNYFIGYETVSVKPIIKSTKIIINK